MKRLTIIIAAAMSFVVLIAAPITYLSVAYSDKIYPGVKINNLDVGGLKPREAAKKLAASRPINRQFYLAAPDYREEINLQTYLYKPDYQLSAERAFSVGRSGSIISNLAAPISLRLNGRDIAAVYRLNKAKLAAHLRRISFLINQPAVDAAYAVSGNKIKIRSEQTGYRLLVDKSIKNVSLALLKNKRGADLAVEQKKPKILSADLRKQGIERLLASFSTDLNPLQAKRNKNIKLAAARLDNHLVPPRTVFSFNKTVGPRSRRRGYLAAAVIVNGNLAKGVGGGICQVATTLYNAYMKAGLPTVERHLHSNYIAAYPIGRDATIAGRRYDLKFKNDYRGFILIKTLTTDERLTIKIYGPKTSRVNHFKRALVTNIVPYKVKSVIDTSLPPEIRVIEQKGISGRTTKVARIVKEHGRVLFKEVIISRYLPRPEIIRLGPPKRNDKAKPVL